MAFEEQSVSKGEFDVDIDNTLWTVHGSLQSLSGCCVQRLNHRLVSCPLSFVAPPFTSATLLPLLREVKSWRELARKLIRTDDDDNPLYLYRYRPDGLTNLDDFQRRHGSDAECLKAVIEMFIRGEGKMKPSWEAVFHSLYETNELRLASKVKSYAEPPKGMRIVKLV